MSAVTTASTEPSTQLDRIEARLAALSEELDAARRERERWRELTHELMPVAQGAMTVASRELEDLSADVTVEDLTRFARSAARTLPQLEAMLAAVAPAIELVHELTSLTGAGVGAVSDGLATAESKGYFTLARGGVQIIDQVAGSFGEEDLLALGENVVLILNTVKQMTQPEVMQFLSRTALDVQAMEGGPPPSTLALLRQLRDPQVRRGLGRALTVLRDVGAAAPDPRPTQKKD